MLKAFPLTPPEFKIGGAEGDFRATIATLNVVDKDGDVTVPGAFPAGKAVKIAAWGHNWGALPVGLGTIGADGTRAWVDGSFFVDTTHGRDTYLTVKALGPLQEWSYGFDVQKADYGEFQGQQVRFLRGLDVFEASPVMVGAGEGTQTDAIKAAWDSAYVSALPDSAFAIVTPDGDRKLPHHDKDGAVDLPHLRNALARVDQVTGVSDAQRSKAKVHLERHASAAGIGKAHGDADHLAAFLSDLKAGSVMSRAHLEQLHGAVRSLQDLHASQCSMGGDCPLTKAAPPDPLSLFAQFEYTLARHALRA